MSLSDLLNSNGHGRCVIMFYPSDKKPGQQPYQGILPLSGEHGPLVDVRSPRTVMHHSEQLDTRMWLTADTNRAVGMLLQKLPGDGGIVPHPGEHDSDTWQRVCHLGSSFRMRNC